MTARSRAAAAWGVPPAVLGAPPEPNAGSRPARDDDAQADHVPFGLAWQQYEAASELRAALRLDARRALAEELSGGRVTYPHEADRPWVRAVPEDLTPAD